MEYFGETATPKSGVTNEYCDDKFVYKNQGVSQAGKFLGIGADGMVTTVTGGGGSGAIDLISAGGKDLSIDANKRVTIDKILTKAQYDALSIDDKNNGTTYIISDEDYLDDKIVQTTGSSSNQVMSQGAVTSELNTLNTAINTKADAANTYTKAETLTASGFIATEAVYDNGSNGTISLSNANIQLTTAGTVTLPTPVIGTTLTLVIYKATEGVITWNGPIVWDGASVPALGIGYNMFNFSAITTSTWLGCKLGVYASV